MSDETEVSAPSLEHESASLLALSGWSRALDRILSGVCHDLNGRVSSLLAVTQLVELGEPLPQTFDSEPRRLEEVARVLAHIPARLGEEPTPQMLGEVLNTALALHAKARGNLAEPPPVEVGDDVPPILVNEGRAVRGVVLLLDHWMASSPPSDRAVTIGSDGSAVLLVVPLGPGGIREGESLEPLKKLFELDGAELRREGDSMALRLPSLASARAAGR